MSIIFYAKPLRCSGGNGQGDNGVSERTWIERERDVGLLLSRSRHVGELGGATGLDQYAPSDAGNFSCPLGSILQGTGENQGQCSIPIKPGSGFKERVGLRCASGQAGVPERAEGSVAGVDGGHSVLGREVHLSSSECFAIIRPFDMEWRAELQHTVQPAFVGFPRTQVLGDNDRDGEIGRKSGEERPQCGDSARRGGDHHDVEGSIFTKMFYLPYSRFHAARYESDARPITSIAMNGGVHS